MTTQTQAVSSLWTFIGYHRGHSRTISKSKERCSPCCGHYRSILRTYTLNTHEKITITTCRRAVVIKNWILPYGIQDSILTDNEAQFVAKFFKTVCHVMGMKQRTTTSYDTQTNGQAERYNKTMAARLRHYVYENQDDWGRYVQLLTCWYNNQPHCTTGTTPFKLSITRAPTTPIVEDISTSAPPDMDFIASGYQTSSSVLKRLIVMFDKANNSFRPAQAAYKGYFD